MAWNRHILAGLLLPLLASAQTPRAVTLIRSQHLRLPVSGEVQRLAVGDPEILAAEPVSSRELLLLGKESGRTTLIVWLRDGSIREYLCSVQRDLKVLQEALRRIEPSLEAEAAPDRDAIVLTGLVPDLSFSQAAESVAKSYLDAGETRRRGASAPLVRGEGETQPAAAPAAEGQAAPRPETVRVGTVAPAPSGKVINLIRLRELPALLEDKIRAAIRPLTGESVEVRRILRGAVRDDSKDVFLLEGTAANQVALTRVLTLAAQMITGRTLSEDDIRVVADEAGALTGNNQNQAGGQQGGQSLGFGGGAGGGLFGGGGGGNRAGRLTNQIRRNIGRAKAVEAADGRILSFVQVADLPQVRVDIRLYEVNRTKLRQYNSSSAALTSDFRQGGLLPAGGAQVVQGSQAARVQGTPGFQNVLSFLGGTLANQLQLSAGRFAIDSIFSFLERNGLARSLSSPSLSVLSGEIAIFQVGGEIPVPESFLPILGVGGANTIPNGIFNSVTFLPFGVQLSVRPLVGDDDTITLDLQPQIATPSAQLTSSIRESTGTNPLTTAFETRALRTSARLQDGQALVVGGLLSRSTNENTAGTPGLKDTPGLGWLFKSFDRTDEGLELVLVVNPVLIRDPNPSVPLWEFPAALDLFSDKAKPVAAAKGATP
ncbi:MAG: pilus assembly protein N-terminal domain-containing protein [Acidobacteria bacterium]|nr:pilus assembly protein N-terminal domain-containing protein [Acidobacteriota bacterium]